MQDLGLPPDDEGVTEGFATLRDVLTIAPFTKIIVVTGHGDQSNALKAAMNASNAAFGEAAHATEESFHGAVRRTAARREAASAGAKPAQSAKRLTVGEHADTDTVVDTGTTGDSLGDILAFGNPIFDAANVKQIGRDQGYCVRTNVGESWECNWTVILDQGSLVVEGPFYDDLRDSRLAITGSTGDFRNARGEMTLHSRNAAGTEFDFIYRLTP